MNWTKVGLKAYSVSGSQVTFEAGLNWTKVGLKDVVVRLRGSAVQSLNWTKVGLKVTCSPRTSNSVWRLNWTKVGLKGAIERCAPSETIWFELD